jgi:hypothetical protein
VYMGEEGIEERSSAEEQEQLMVMGKPKKSWSNCQSKQKGWWGGGGWRPAKESELVKSLEEVWRRWVNLKK